MYTRPTDILVYMYAVDDAGFDDIVSRAIAAIPEPFNGRIQNLVFTIEDVPSPHQRAVAKLKPYQTLFGLYEGIPLIRRGGNYTMVLPDKITVFKTPHEHASDSLEAIQKLVYKTVWHEVAHYFGLDHAAIESIEAKQNNLHNT